MHSVLAQNKRLCWSWTFQHKSWHLCLLLWCLLGFITIPLYKLWFIRETKFPGLVVQHLKLRPPGFYFELCLTVFFFSTDDIIAVNKPYGVPVHCKWMTLKSLRLLKWNINGGHLWTFLQKSVLWLWFLRGLIALIPRWRTKYSRIINLLTT